MKACPNLVRLYISSQQAQLFTGLEDAVFRAYRDHRQFNINAQLAHTWPRLGECTASVVDLYLLGIVCPISAISVDVLPCTLSLIPEVLERAQPTSLKLEVHSVENFPIVFTDLFRLPGTAQIEDLTVSVGDYYAVDRGLFLHQYFVGTSPPPNASPDVDTHMTDANRAPFWSLSTDQSVCPISP